MLNAKGKIGENLRKVEREHSHEKMQCFEAVIDPNGTEKWYVKGEYHREGGPAVIDPDGTKKWHRKGKLHREDGPAVIHADGRKEWWINGISQNRILFYIKKFLYRK